MENFASLFEKHLANAHIREGELIQATVVGIDSKNVIVNAGLKSESLIPISEFKNERGELEVAVGDVTEVVIESVEDGYGETKLSREKARKAAAWRELEQALENQEILTGLVYGRIKGGLGVLYKNVKLFLPGSLLDVRTVRDFVPYENQDVEFKVIKVDRRRSNIVISRKAVLLDRNDSEVGSLADRIQEGNIVKGIVKNITDYGAFVDLGGIDGLLYITDLSWKRVKHPAEVLTVGMEVEAKVLKFDKEKHRVSLGLKQLSSDPWQDVESRYPVGMRLYGKISNITDYGAFVELESGIEGLVHVSEMDWTNKNVNPNKVVKAGDEVQVQVLEVDGSKRRVSLGLKQCQENPWIEFAEKFKKSDKIKGKIRSITEFGIFVGLEGGIDGLIHVSDISWTIPGDTAIKEYKKGDEVEAVVTAIDVEKERIALSIRQLNDDPYARFLANYDKGSVITGIVQTITPESAMLELADSIVATLPVKEAASDKVDNLTELFKVGDKVEVLITQLDKKLRDIVVSVKAKEELDTVNAIKQFKQAEKTTGTTNLGVLLQDKFNEEEL